MWVCHFSFALHFVLLQVFGIIILVFIWDLFLAVLAIDNQSGRLLFFSIQIPTCYQLIIKTLAVSPDMIPIPMIPISMIPISLMGCAPIEVEVLAVWTLREVFLVLLAICIRLEKYITGKSGSQSCCTPPPNQALTRVWRLWEWMIRGRRDCGERISFRTDKWTADSRIERQWCLEG